MMSVCGIQRTLNRIIRAALITLLLCLTVYADEQASSDTTTAKSTTTVNQFKQIWFKPIHAQSISGDEQQTPCSHHINAEPAQLKRAGWSEITFDALPQDQHFCLQAFIQIEPQGLPEEPSLLVGMLGSATFYWDGSVLTQNGVPGSSATQAQAGSIKTLVRIPEPLLSQGSHVLSAEVSTFSGAKQFQSIGFVLALVDDQWLTNMVLIISLLSGVFVGVLIILFAIFQLINRIYQAQRFYLMFSTLCLSAALLLGIEQAKFWLNYPINWHAFRLYSIFVLTLVTSCLLPMFYVAYYRLHAYWRWMTAIGLSQFIIGLFHPSFDTSSVFLFFGAMCWTLALNLYQVRQRGHARFVTVLNLLALLAIIGYPGYFTEFGFALFIIVTVMSMLVLLIGEMRRHKDRSLHAQRIKTELLRRNMQPHFLMNCLTQLMELVETQPQAANQLITALSEEFRKLTLHSEKDYVPLSDELSLCNNHLEIMSLRYQQIYQLKVIGEIDGIWVPSSVLHCLIENSFTHNKISINRVFELKIQCHDRQVELTLHAPIENKTGHVGTGTGQQFIEAKLSELNQSQATFSSRESDGFWVSTLTYCNELQELQHEG